MYNSSYGVQFIKQVLTYERDKIPGCELVLLAANCEKFTTKNRAHGSIIGIHVTLFFASSTRIS